jgi:4-hydroxy-tetrahydrodipicolinate synthase
MATRRKFSGSATALVTPFKTDGSLDEQSLRKLVRFQIDGGTDILIPCGTTGESPTVTEDEYTEMMKIVVDENRKSGNKAMVVAGAGSNSTHHAIKLSKTAEKLGVSGLLIVGPYYNKPMQEGFFQHYKAIAAETSLPIMVYNVPGRTGSNINADTLIRMADEIPNVQAVKEASGNMAQIMDLLKNRPSHLSVMSGDDAFTLPMMALGADGVVSVASNEIPHEMKQLAEYALAGDFENARKIHEKYLNLFNLNFIESNPIPVKYVLSKMGITQSTVRLPMVAISESAARKLDAEIEKLGLVKSAAVLA